MATADAAADPAAPTSGNVLSALWLGSLGLLILGIQPVVLEPLVRFGRLDEASLGAAATAAEVLRNSRRFIGVFIERKGAGAPRSGRRSRRV